MPARAGQPIAFAAFLIAKAYRKRAYAKLGVIAKQA